MKVLGVLFGLFMGGQGVRAILNGRDVLGCLAIAVGLVMFGTVFLLSARAKAGKSQPADEWAMRLATRNHLAGMSDESVVAEWRATLLGNEAHPSFIAPDMWRALVCAEVMHRKL